MNVEKKGVAAVWIDRAIVVCLLIFVAFAPHSIAVTQSAWFLGLLFWVARFAFSPSPQTHRTPLDYALFSFFILTGLSSFVSYEPLVSIGKLRAASLFTIVYLFAENVSSRRLLRVLVLLLVASTLVNVVYTAGQRVVGRGVKIQGLKVDSSLYAAGIRSGDTLLEVDGNRISDPQDLFSALVSNDRRPALVKIYRVEWLPTLKVERGHFLEGREVTAKLGIENWTRGRDWRASGFFGMYVTYAEILQLILAVAIGLLLALPVKRSWLGAFLLLVTAGMIYALVMTVTRASWLAFLISTATILMFGATRRTIVVVGILALPLVLVALFVLQQKRNVGFLDPHDGSTTWRETVWREGFELLKGKPRHLLVGVGMDSLKSHWREWGLFDGGRLPWGHMHSNPLQLALERGIPALMVWLILLGLYARTLWQTNRRLKRMSEDLKSGDSILGLWVERGLVLGGLGGLIGFFTSGLVHYNWGDSEVVMVFYLVMGLNLVAARFAHSATNKPTSRPASGLSNSRVTR